MTQEKITFQETLEKLVACEEAREWAGDMSIEQVWETCERGDWMLWLAFKSGVDIRLLTSAKAECAALAIPFMKDERSIAAIAAARAFGRGEIGQEQLSVAAAAAKVALATAATAAAAATASYTAASTKAAYAEASTTFAYAPAEYAAIAYAIIAPTYDCSVEKARVLSQCAKIVRGIIPCETIKEALAL